MSQAKNILLARMATARAALWRELLALDGETLVTTPITAAWTAKDILAHVAAWDDMHAERVELINGGRAAEIARTERDALNAELYAEREDWPLARAVEAAQAARGRFLAALAPLSWADICREYDSPAGKLSIRFLAERRAKHDELHAQEIRDWQASAEPEETPGPRSVLAAALDAGRSALLAWGQVVPSEAFAAQPVCGEWTWQDVLGHVADWEMFSVRGLQAMAAGDVGGEDWDEELERWNQAHAAQRRGEPLAQTWADFNQAREDLLGLLAGYDDRKLAQPAATAVEDLDAHYFWFSTCFGHDYEHAVSMAECVGNVDLDTQADATAAGAVLAHPQVLGDKINLAEKFALFSDQWRPKIVAELNGQYVKLARLEGEFVWHRHEVEDELFFVLGGELTLRFRDREVKLGQGEMLVVPAGVEHQPFAAAEAQVLLLEPKSTRNTGDVRNERTVDNLDWI